MHRPQPSLREAKRRSNPSLDCFATLATTSYRIFYKHSKTDLSFLLRAFFFLTAALPLGHNQAVIEALLPQQFAMGTHFRNPAFV